MKQNRKIILIMTDTQRWDMLGCYGNKDMVTPSLDRLASQGIRFNRAYTTQPVCGPARSAIFTGTFPIPTEAGETACPLATMLKLSAKGLEITDFIPHILENTTLTAVIILESGVVLMAGTDVTGMI